MYFQSLRFFRHEEEADTGEADKWPSGWWIVPAAIFGLIFWVGVGWLIWSLL